MSFLAEDKYLHGLSFEMVIRCEIDPRASPNTAVNPFKVITVDECFGTAIGPLASRASYKIPLYFFDETAFTPAG